MSRPLAASLLSLSALLLLPRHDARAADGAPMVRTWSDATGRFKIKGSFVSLENDVVTILQENGKEVEVPLRKLDAVSKAFAAEAAKAAAENPFQEKGEDSPFKEKGAAGEPPTADSADTPTLKTGPVAVDWNDSRAVDPQPESSNWADAIKPEQLAEGAPALKPKTVTLPKRLDFFEGVRNVAFSPSAEKAVVGYTLQKPGVDRSTTTRLVLVDTKTGKSLGSGATDGEFIPVGLDSDGRRLLVRKEKFGFGESDALEVWGLGKSGIYRGLSWTPHDDLQGAARDIKWAAVVADGLGLSLGASGRLALWNLDDAAPVWHLDLPRDHVPALSPNRKYLAYEAESAVGLLDLEAGKVLALLPTEKLMLSALGFSPDGKFLAATTGDTLWVWDVATGGLHREINLRAVGGHGGLVWTDPEHVLIGLEHAIGGTTLVHVESRIPVWRYTGARNIYTGGGITWFYVSPHTGGEALVGADLPHAAAEQALKQAMADPNFFILKPGSTVALDASGIPDPDRPAVTESLRKSVTDAGFKIAASAPVVVKASMSRGETRQIRYHMFGRLGEETHNVQEYLLDLAFVAGGKNAWETRYAHVPAPGFVSLKQGQTIADLLREHDKPGYEFYANVRLPKFVPRPSDRPVLGASEVALQGVR